MLSGAFYSFGYAFEIVSSNLEQIRFWLRIEYIGISFGTLFWFIMVLQYTNRHVFLRKWIIVLLTVVPFLTFTSHYTNEWHFLFYKSMVIDMSEGFPLVSLFLGPFYILHVVYSYILFMIGMGLLIQMYRKAAIHMKKQITFMIIGSCCPYFITLVYLSGALNTPIDISPFGFIFSGIFFMWGIYQFNLLKLPPLAFQKVFESMNDAVIVFDLDHSITSFNNSAKQIIKGLSGKKVIGQSAVHIFYSYPALLETILQESDSLIETKIEFKNPGDPRYYNVHVSYVYGSSRNPIGKMLLLRDITKTVQAEEVLLKNSRQMSDLNAFKDKMFTVVAHDIRDPIAILISLMEVLKDKLQTRDKSLEEILNEMEQQIQNTFNLTESLLDWFRSQREGKMYNPVVWNLSKVVQINEQLLKVHRTRKRIQISFDIPHGMFVYADKEMLDFIIRNLLSNAIKFTDFGGSIQIKAIQLDDKVVISVRDTGEGISPEQANNLFQEDYPNSSTGTAGERGIGLGLTLCREFVRMNKGDIWFDSLPEQGTNFYFTMPSVSRRTHDLMEKDERVSTG